MLGFIAITFLVTLKTHQSMGYHPCSTEHYCVCWTEENIKYMDCSFKDILSIPLCPSDINVLYLQGNGLITIQSMAFKNLINLTLLNLARNEIFLLESDAFYNLHNLKTLNLERNSLKESDYQKGIFKPLTSLTYLNTRFNSHTSIPDTILSDLTMINKLSIDFFYNFDSSHGNGFTALKDLKELDTGYCRIKNFKKSTFMYMKHLETIDLSNCQRIITYGLGALKITNLTNLTLSNADLDFGNVKALMEDIQLTPIKILVMENALGSKPDIEVLQTVFEHLNDTAIEEIYMEENQLRCHGEYHLPLHLRTLDLSSNRIAECFFIMPNLNKLSLQNNRMGQFLSKFPYSLSAETRLEYVDLSFNNIKKLHSLIFEGHTQIKTINLSNNKLQEVTFDLSQTETLKMLDLSSNSIAFFDRKTIANISKIIKKSNLTVDLTNNMLECTCSTFHFLKWMVSNSQHFHGYQDYKCKIQNGSVIFFKRITKTILLLEKECSSHLALIVGISLGIITACTVVCFGLIYRYRWKLRYMYYVGRRRFQNNQSLLNHAQYIFDAFISYSDQDSDFVFNECISNLEENGTLKLCIHQRDFTPGKEIYVNISEAIHSSRKTICIITQSFLESYYCMFEFNMARMESIYSRGGQNILLLVMYEPMQTRDLPLIILELVQKQSSTHMTNKETLSFGRKLENRFCEWCVVTFIVFVHFYCISY